MTEAALIQDLTEKLGKETADGLFTFFQTSLKDKHSETATKGDVEAAVSKASAEMIKWMFLFWVGQLAVTIGVVLLIIKHNN